MQELTSWRAYRHMAEVHLRRHPRLLSLWNHEEIICLYWEVQDCRSVTRLSPRVRRLLARFDWRELPPIFLKQTLLLDYLITRVKHVMEGRIRSRAATVFARSLSPAERADVVFGRGDIVPWDKMHPLVPYSMIRRILRDSLVAAILRGDICLLENTTSDPSSGSYDKAYSLQLTKSNGFAPGSIGGRGMDSRTRRLINTLSARSASAQATRGNGQQADVREYVRNFVHAATR